MGSKYVQVVRGNWNYGETKAENGMILVQQDLNNTRLFDQNFLAPFSGEVTNLPRCATCNAWFATDSMFQGHLRNTHGQGLRQMREARQVRIEELARLRDQAVALNTRIDLLRDEVLHLDTDIAAKEAELAAAQTPAADGVHVPNAPMTRVSLG